MGRKGDLPGRAAHAARSRLDDSEQLLDRKRRQRTTGLVEIPGPLAPALEEEIRNVARRFDERDPGASVLRITPFQLGLAIETASEKLAQQIADAIARSRKAEVTRVFDDEGRRRILTCRLPSIGG